MATTTTFYMSLILPNVTVNPEPGPDWASELNAAFGLVDSHDHSPGKGTKVPVAGLNINADFDMGGYAVKNAKHLALGTSASPITSSLYQIAGDLYWKTATGYVQVTSGSLLLAAGGFSGLASPGGATWTPILGFSLFSDTGTGDYDNLNLKTVKLLDVVGGFPVTISSTGSAQTYTLKVPTTLPASTKIVRMDNAGQLAADLDVDNSTIEVNAGALRVKPNSIGPTQLSSGVGAFPTGGIIPWGGNASGSVSTFTGPDLATYKGIPGYLYCDGTAVSRTVFSDLFAVVSTSYGEGDGSTTFNLPDARGMFLRGWNETQSNPAYSDKDAASRTAMAPGGNVGNFPGSVQTDAFEAHTHTVTSNTFNNGASLPITYAVSGGSSSFATSSAGGTETRPQNFAVSYLIKY